METDAAWFGVYGRLIEYHGECCGEGHGYWHGHWPAVKGMEWEGDGGLGGRW